MAILMVRGINIAIFLGLIITVILGVIFGIVDAPTAIMSMSPSVEPTLGVAIKHISEVFN